MIPPSIVDTHCHLDFSDFKDDVPELITRAVNAGVTRMVTICTQMKNEPFVRMLAQKYSQVFYAAGVHPMYVTKEPIINLESLLQITTHPKMIGIGETGLDYFYTQDSKAQQKQSLAVHIEAARQSKLPLIIHSRAADDDMADILQAEMAQGEFTCVMHCFSSSPELARVALDLGFYLSMSGIATFKKSDALREIFAKAPIERILVETDSPYLAPVPYRGKRNEPAYVVHTAHVGAEIFAMDYDEFAQHTTTNFERLFSKVMRYGG